jgi:superfamily I DNA/RNA helicase
MKPFIYVGKEFMAAKERLPIEIKRKVDSFFPKFQENSRSKALDFEKIKTFKDKSFRTVRIDDNYRAIVSFPNKGNYFFMLWVDKHNEAHAWAENKYFEWNQNVHSWQLYKKEVAIVPAVEIKLKIRKDFPHPYGIIKEDLIQLGVPDSELDAILEIISIDKLEERREFLPESAYEKILSIFNGVDKRELLEQVKEGKSDSENPEEQMLSANNLQYFIPLTDDEDLQKFIRGELYHWQFFLHPEQTKLVKTKFKGPVKITGGAGTGKTVAALHRFKHLVENGLPNGNRLLFCTYTNALAKNINAMVSELKISHRGCFDIMTIHAIAHKLASDIPPISKLIEKNYSSEDITLSANQLKTRNLKIWEAILDNTILTPEFAEEEYRKVILFHQVESKDVYLNTNREGREIKISLATKNLFWDKHLLYLADKKKKYKLESDELFYALTKHYRSENTKPYAHVILDELQDLSNIELRFLRYIVKPGINDMFMVGDPLQKVYDRHINFSSLKISTVGRSKRLLRNYRTTEEIRKDAVKIILSEEFSDFGDSNEKITGYFSIGKGPEPTYIHFNSKEEEIHYVEMKLKELLESGLYNPEDICFAAQKKDTIQEFHTHFHKQGLKINMIEKNHEISVPEYLNTSTFHSLKGLEFKVIFLVGLNAQSFLRPRKYNSDIERKEAEKRDKALLYVAMTRAKMLLYISGNGTRSTILQKIYPYQK